MRKIKYNGNGRRRRDDGSREEGMDEPWDSLFFLFSSQDKENDCETARKRRNKLTKHLLTIGRGLCFVFCVVVVVVVVVVV